MGNEIQLSNRLVHASQKPMSADCVNVACWTQVYTSHAIVYTDLVWVSFFPQCFLFFFFLFFHLGSNLFWKECGKHQQYYNTNYSIGCIATTVFCTKHVIMSVMYFSILTTFRAAIKKTFLFILFVFISTITWHIIPHFICDILFYFHILLPLLKIVALCVIKISGGHIKVN